MCCQYMCCFWSPSFSQEKKKKKKVLTYIHSLSLGGTTSTRVVREGGELACELQAFPIPCNFACLVQPAEQGWDCTERVPGCCGMRTLRHAVISRCKAAQRMGVGFAGSARAFVLAKPSPSSGQSAPSLVPQAAIPDHQTSAPRALSNPTWTLLPEKGPQRGFAPLLLGIHNHLNKGKRF